MPSVLSTRHAAATARRSRRRSGGRGDRVPGIHLARHCPVRGTLLRPHIWRCTKIARARRVGTMCELTITCICSSYFVQCMGKRRKPLLTSGQSQTFPPNSSSLSLCPARAKLLASLLAKLFLSWRTAHAVQARSFARGRAGSCDRANEYNNVLGDVRALFSVTITTFSFQSKTSTEC